jgi:arylsulfatase A-like enzyme
MGRVLSEAGYDCAYAGKWHNGGGEDENKDPHDIPRDEHYNHGFRRIAGFDDHALADACLEFFDETTDQPFLLSVNFDDPHNICEWARNEQLPWGNVDRVPWEECPSLPKNFAIPPFEPDPIQTERREGSPMQSLQPDEWRHYRHAYYRLIERVDHELGRILDGLERHGLDENTLVVFTSDHGDGNGQHQLHQKWDLYEGSTRVPLLVAGPGTSEGTVRNELVSNGLDILPTFCDYAEADCPDGLRGRSLRPLIEKPAAEEWREYVVTQAHRLNGRMIRTDQYKYTVYSNGRPREQLFDMNNDPGEMVNLAVDDRYDDILDRHRALLLDWCCRTGDIFDEHYSHPGLPTIPGYEYAEIENEWPA